MSTETLLKQLEEYQAVTYLSIDSERRNLVLQILKQQQETIREQKELIENLWAWAEEKDEVVENEPSTSSTQDYDASVYTRIM